MPAPAAPLVAAPLAATPPPPMTRPVGPTPVTVAYGGSGGGGDAGSGLPSLKRLRLSSTGPKRQEASAGAAYGSHWAPAPLRRGEVSPTPSSSVGAAYCDELTPSPLVGAGKAKRSRTSLVEADKETSRERLLVPSLPTLASVLAGVPSRELGRLGAEYAADGFRRLLLQERRSLPLPDYMARQRDIDNQMRGILVDWIVAVHKEQDMRSETLHLAVSLFDRHLCIAPQVDRERLQLVGMTALLVAAKYEEVSRLEVESAVQLTDNLFSAKEVLQMECVMLSSLEFEVACPTATHFLPLMQAVGRVRQSKSADLGLLELLGLRTQSSNGARVAELIDELASYLVELSLLDVRMTEYLPSQVAASAMILSSRIFERTPLWPQSLEWLVGHSEASLRPCCRALDALRRAAPEFDLHEVAQKYPIVAMIGLRAPPSA